MNRSVGWLLFGTVVFLGGCGSNPQDLMSCLKMSFAGLRPIADERDQRFLGKVQEATARCRGGDRAVAARHVPWVDWASYWATGDAGSRAATATFNFAHLSSNGRGSTGPCSISSASASS